MNGYDEYLEHSGTKGMKWGIRRYQNKDGTWTEEGKRRRRTGEGEPSSTVPRIKELATKTRTRIVKDVKAMAESYEKKREERKVERAEKKAAKEAERAEQAETRAKEELTRAVAQGDAKTILKYRERMTDSELNQAYQRANTINNLNKLVPVEVKKTKLDMIKGYADYTNNMANILGNMSKMKKSLDELKGKTNSDKNSNSNKNSDSKNSQNKTGDKPEEKPGKKPNKNADTVDGVWKDANDTEWNWNSPTVDGKWRSAGRDDDIIDASYREVSDRNLLTGPTYKAKRKKKK